VWQGGLMKDPANAVLVETLERLQVTSLEFGMPDSAAPATETPQ